MPPKSYRRTAVVRLESGSAVPAELANNRIITAEVRDISYPTIAVAVTDVPGQIAAYPVPGRLQPMTLTVNMITVYAGMLATLGLPTTLEIVERLYNPGAAGITQLVTDCTGILNSSNFGQLDLGSDDLRPVTFEYRLTKYKQVKTGVAEPIYDIDLDNEIAKQNGVNII